MKIDSGIFRTFLQNVTRSFGDMENPQHDWRRILVGSVVLMLVYGFFGVQLFLQTQSGSIFTSFNDSVVTIDTINRTELSEVLEVFRTQEATFDNIQTSPPTVFDPSL